MIDLPEHIKSESLIIPSPPWEKMGWGQKNETEQEKIMTESEHLEQMLSSTPRLFEVKQARDWEPTLKKKWDDFQQSKGYDPGSFDLTLMDMFVMGRRFHWFPQDTGSCVISNAYRAAVRRCLAEIMLKGQLEEAWGDTEYGNTSISFYAPYSYALGREKAGIRSGDGSYCEVQIWALQQGVLLCSNGRLNEILNGLNAASEKDFPEPRSVSVYRKFQSWTYNDELKPFLVNPLTESLPIKTVEDLDVASKQLKPAIMCSMIAIKKGPVVDGLQTYIVDPNNEWAHNMCWHGFFIWKGKKYYLLSNESWGKDIIYPISEENVAKMLRRSDVVCMTLGEFDLTDTPVAA